MCIYLESQQKTPKTSSHLYLMVSQEMMTNAKIFMSDVRQEGANIVHVRVTFWSSEYCGLSKRKLIIECLFVKYRSMDT